MMLASIYRKIIEIIIFMLNSRATFSGVSPLMLTELIFAPFLISTLAAPEPEINDLMELL